MARAARIKGRWLAGAALVAALAAGAVAWHRSNTTHARLAERVRSSPDDDRRRESALALVNAGADGRTELRSLLMTGDEPACAAIAAALHESLNAMPPGDGRRAELFAFLLDCRSQCAEPGQLVVVDLIPALLNGAPPDLVKQAREAVATSLAGDSAEVARRAVRLAMRPELNMKAEIVPSLRHTAARVRKEAMLAVGPAMAGDAVIADEELFPWLHDADAEVRLLCEAALSTRGLEPDQVEAARKLTDPDAAERLALVVQLRFGGESLGQPGPWLERLSRDADPAVRAGAARVACERKLPFAAWVKRLAQEDPDAGVRQVAEFHRGRADLQQTGGGD